MHNKTLQKHRTFTEKALPPIPSKLGSNFNPKVSFSDKLLLLNVPATLNTKQRHVIFYDQWTYYTLSHTECRTLLAKSVQYTAKGKQEVNRFKSQDGKNKQKALKALKTK